MLKVWEKPPNCEITVAGNITWDILFNSIYEFTRKTNVTVYNLFISPITYSLLNNVHNAQSHVNYLQSKVCWVRLEKSLRDVYYLENPEFTTNSYILKVNLFGERLHYLCKRRKW